MIDQTVVSVPATDVIGAHTVSIPDVRRGAKGYVAALVVSSLPGAGQTIDVKIRDSMDGATWADVASFTQQVSGSLAPEKKSWGLWDASPVYTSNYLQVVYTIGVADDAGAFEVRLEPIY